MSFIIIQLLFCGVCCEFFKVYRLIKVWLCVRFSWFLRWSCWLIYFCMKIKFITVKGTKGIPSGSNIWDIHCWEVIDPPSIIRSIVLAPKHVSHHIWYYPREFCLVITFPSFYPHHLRSIYKVNIKTVLITKQTAISLIYSSYFTISIGKHLQSKQYVCFYELVSIYTIIG